MDLLLPNGFEISVPRLYGNYRNIRETTVRLFRDTDIQYYLLTGNEYGRNGRKVYSILCTKTVNGMIEDSEYVYDVAETREEAEKVFTALYKNTVTPCCMLEIVEDLLG